MKLQSTKGVILLLHLIEECAEVIQRACKTIRFGLEERQDSSSATFEETNKERMTMECCDLATVQQLCQEHDLLGHIGPKLSKREKVFKYFHYSKDRCGTVLPD